MSARRRKGEGACLRVVAFGVSALASIMTIGHAGAESLAPAIANLPRPGSYVLQRIQRVPEADLLDADGKRVALSTYVTGAITALGFFYGHCDDPGGCPVGWSIFEAARTAAAADPLLAGKLRLVFLSLDPARDTPAALRLLASAEGDGEPPWHFLTGQSEERLAPLLHAMGQDVDYVLDPAGRRSGVISHMLKVFLIDPEGWAREIYSSAFLAPENLLNDMRTLALAFPDANGLLRER